MKKLIVILAVVFISAHFGFANPQDGFVDGNYGSFSLDIFNATSNGIQFKILVSGDDASSMLYEKASMSVDAKSSISGIQVYSFSKNWRVTIKLFSYVTNSVVALWYFESRSGTYQEANYTFN